MNEFEIEFLKAMESFGSIIVKEEYRIYHDDDGKVLYVVAHKFPDDNDNWIAITKVQYQTLECQWLWIVFLEYIVLRMCQLQSQYPSDRTDLHSDQ